MSIELKKIKLEIIKMDANIMESEIRIEERMAEVERIENNIKKSKEKKEELLLKIKE